MPRTSVHAREGVNPEYHALHNKLVLLPRREHRVCVAPSGRLEGRQRGGGQTNGAQALPTSRGGARAAAITGVCVGGGGGCTSIEGPVGCARGQPPRTLRHLHRLGQGQPHVRDVVAVRNNHCPHPRPIHTQPRQPCTGQNNEHTTTRRWASTPREPPGSTSPPTLPPTAFITNPAPPPSPSSRPPRPPPPQHTHTAYACATPLPYSHKTRVTADRVARM